MADQRVDTMVRNRLPRRGRGMRLLAPAWIAAVVGGCLFGGPDLPQAEEVLIPEITDDGTKFFVLERRYANPRTMQSSDDREAMPGPPPDIGRRVEQILETTGYCRQGYFELYQEHLQQVRRLRGECREAASQKDRERFAGRVLQIDPS